ncbi:site-2 protease family protein, partial [Candidatus Woesearchaeota archaeon]|nr:site-2 protease family protein [Candidatus Woesearchaeota archaeon]
GYFPTVITGISKNTYWLMGFIAAALLFVSVLLHELSHSLVAKAKKIGVESITLFFFGGVAGIEREDIEPKAELLMALAGPLFSLFLAGFFYLIFLFNGSNLFWSAITNYLAQLNFTLALFNLVPGFPLDGGRAFRAVLHWYYKDLRKATKIAVWGGKFFAGVLVFLGVLSLFTNGGNALWFIVLGGFLYFIAGASYEQVVVRQVLGNIKIREVMKKSVAGLSPSMKLDSFLQKFKYAEETTFVVRDKSFLGVVDVQQEFPSVLKNATLKKVARPVGITNSVQMQESAYEAFKKCIEQKREGLLVFDKGKLAGIVTRTALVRALLWEVQHGK